MNSYEKALKKREKDAGTWLASVPFRVAVAELKRLRKDKARLDWLTKHGDFHAYGDSIYVRVMPESLENGQTVRGAIDADMRQARQS